MAFQTEYEFELPRGYLDRDGVLHKSGSMRLANEDFERLVMQTPGLMLKSVKVIRGLQINGKQGGGPERQENCVTIVVKPCSV